jgi:hypothetical protein
MSKISAGITTLTALQSEADVSGELQLRTNGSTTALTLGTDQSATFAGAATFSSTATVSGGLNESQVDITDASPVIDCSAGNVFAITTTGNPVAFTASNVPASGTAYGFILKITASGTVTVNYAGLGTLYWAGGTAPDAPASGETDVLGFLTYDGGTSWYGFLAGDAMA